MDYDVLEQLNKEKIDLKNSPAYKKGMALQRYGSYLKSGNLAAFKKDIQDNLAARKIRRKFMNHLERPETDRNQADIQTARIAVYTCVLGGYDALQRPLPSFENVDFVLFTDDPKRYKAYEDVFRIVPLDRQLLEKGNILANRYVKFHPAQFLPEYDYAIYMDGNVRVMGDIRKFIRRLPQESGIAMHNHRERDDVYSEAEVCKLLRRGDPNRIDVQMSRYRNAGFPRHFGMNEATVIVSDLKNEQAVHLLDDWWQEFVKSQSFRDQLAWPFVLWENNVLIEEVGNLGNNIYENPKLEIVRHS